VVAFDFATLRTECFADELYPLRLSDGCDYHTCGPELKE
jgi:hypothetical protein